jgi:hypothetical protein
MLLVKLFVKDEETLQHFSNRANDWVGLGDICFNLGVWKEGRVVELLNLDF